MEKTQLHHKAKLTYTFQEVETILFMAFSPGKFCRTMNSRIDFNVLLHGLPQEVNLLTDLLMDVHR